MHNLLKRMNILCFGDSLTEGYYNGGKNFHPYTWKLKELLEEKANSQQCSSVTNAGVSGETICVDMKARLPNSLKKHGVKNVDVLIMQGGTNDILKYTDLQTSLDLFQEFQKLLKIAVDSGSVRNILILTTLEGFYTSADEAVMSHKISDDFRRTFNQKILESYSSSTKEEQQQQQQICAAKIKVCDIAKEFPLFSLDEAERKALWDDNIHPSVSGYDKMGEIIFENLKEFL